MDYEEEADYNNENWMDVVISLFFIMWIKN
jgi:hypothetical protein